MRDLYLAHHGTKGMRWGIRRYQNKDGSLTDLGRRRLSSSDEGSKTLDDSGNVKSGKEARATSLLRDEVSKDYRNASKISTSTSELAKAAARREMVKSDKEVKKILKNMDVESMSDDDLRKAVNRMNMERTYKQLTAERIETGRSRTVSRLETIGEIAAVGSSIAGILIAINELKK